MGADMCLQYFEWPRGRRARQSQKNLGKKLDKMYAIIDELEKEDDDQDELVAEALQGNNTKYDELREDVTVLKDACLDGRRDCAVITIENTYVLITGGMSWGDPPTDLYNVFDRLYDAEVM